VLFYPLLSRRLTPYPPLSAVTWKSWRFSPCGLSFTPEGLEIAHQQLRSGKHDLTFSACVRGRGALILELNVGDPVSCGARRAMWPSQAIPIGATACGRRPGSIKSGDTYHACAVER